jgi:hypothetical protein
VSLDRGRRLTARHVSREVLRRALAVEIIRNGIERPALELAVPGTLLRDVRHLARGMSRDDCLIMLGNMAMMARGFAAEIQADRLEELFAELDELGDFLEQLAGA